MGEESRSEDRDDASASWQPQSISASFVFVAPPHHPPFLSLLGILSLFYLCCIIVSRSVRRVVNGRESAASGCLQI